MKGFTKGLVQHRILIIILCAALVVPSVLGMVRTKTKYDLLYYLPQDLETVQGQEILLKDFGKGAFSLLVTEGMSLKEQADMENALKEIPHVESVIGYASLTKGMLPAEIIPEDLREKFLRGDCMLSAVFFDEGSSSEETMEAISRVRKVAGEKTFVSGLSAVVTDTRKLVEDQEAIYVAIAVALCAIVLTLTMDSFLLPLMYSSTPHGRKPFRQSTWRRLPVERRSLHFERGAVLRCLMRPAAQSWHAMMWMR